MEVKMKHDIEVDINNMKEYMKPDIGMDMLPNIKVDMKYGMKENMKPDIGMDMLPNIKVT